MQDSDLCLVCGHSITSKKHLDRVQYCYYMLHSRFIDLKKTQNSTATFEKEETNKTTQQVIRPDDRFLGIYQCRQEHPKSVARVFQGPHDSIMVILFCKWCSKDENFQDFIDEEYLVDS